MSVATVLLGGLVACNAILGNEEGTLRVTTPDAGSSSLEGGGPGPGADAAPDGGGGEAGPPLCDTTQGNKVCFGLCVKINETSTGCGESSCAACDPKNVDKATCKGGQTTLGCAYDKCKDGFDSCDGNDANGCEASLNRKETCGSCNVKCDPDGGTPFCALSSGSYACVSACPGGTTDCSGACVDTTSSVENCGACGKKCDRPSATASCQNSNCQFTCIKGTHECGQTCASDVDPKTCGSSCTPCPALDNATSTCDNGQCGFLCTSPFSDCNGDPKDGCETKGPCTVDDCSNRCLPGQKCCFSTFGAGSCVAEGKPCPLPL